MTATHIFQKTIPYDPRVHRKLPGIQPLNEAPWLMVDDAYAAQMAERDRLIAETPDVVIARVDGFEAEEQELFDAVLNNLPEGFQRNDDTVTRPDDVTITLDRSAPIRTLGQIVQEDLCLLTKPEGAEEHILISAVLCFPARWSIRAKIGKPLIPIHAPVAEYDGDIAKRVQRLFDGIQPGRPIWRYNKLWDEDPTLHQPIPSKEHPKWVRESAPFLRSERQCLIRLPETRAILFSIHTFVIERAGVEAQWGKNVTKST